jgi:hypothetical protein
MDTDVEPMPFKSQAQRRKFAELLVKGKISPETFEEWNRETGGAKLPERVKRKRTAAAAARTTKAATKKATASKRTAARKATKKKTATKTTAKKR